MHVAHRRHVDKRLYKLSGRTNPKDLEQIKTQKMKITGALWWTYVISLLFRIVFEVTFMYLFYMIYPGYKMIRLGLRYRRARRENEASKALSEAVMPYVPNYNYYPGHPAVPEPFPADSKYSMAEPNSPYSPYNSKVVYKQNRDNMAVERKGKAEGDDVKEMKTSSPVFEVPIENQRRNSQSSKHSTNKSRLDDLKI
ncbi:gap junction protein%2C alpha 2 [Scomber scombrus]|uniref:Gap junction protein, alpha 2 n=1 Tax=Scomber scombrus TaxID=13677 RepID=A0AAV1N4Z3_SCOSC